MAGDDGVRRTHDVSIPFIAGQWSLQLEALARLRSRAEFQSPSLRGSGRFVHEWKYDLH